MNSEFKDAMDCVKIDACVESLQYIREKLANKGLSKRSATYEFVTSIITQMEKLKQILEP